MSSHAALVRSRGLRPGTAELRLRTEKRADEALPYCVVPGCGRPTAARAKRGLSHFYCRNCCQKANRHGCHWKTTYPAATLNPYRKAATRFIRSNHLDFWVVNALHSLSLLLDHSGPVERIVDVNELLKPHEKARAALARLRRAEIKPERLLAIYLSVCCAIARDPVSPGSESRDYRRVQAAKAVFRLASGYHVVYAPGVRYDRYPRSGGVALRHLGRMLEEACEHVQGKHLDAILTMATGRDAQAKS